MSYCPLKSIESHNYTLSLLTQICDNTSKTNQAVGASTSDLCSAKDDER